MKPSWMNKKSLLEREAQPALMEAPVRDPTAAVPAPAKLPAECSPSVLFQLAPRGAEEPSS